MIFLIGYIICGVVAALMARNAWFKDFGRPIEMIDQMSCAFIMLGSALAWPIIFVLFLITLSFK